MYCSLILHILEAKVRANVWTVQRDKKLSVIQRGVRCGEVTVSGGSTV